MAAEIGHCASKRRPNSHLHTGKLDVPSAFSDQRILLVNDDGINARGIALLEDVARRFSDDIWIVAPDNECSGSSHAISLSTPVRVRRLGDRRFAIKGTPVDCVLLAIHDLMAAAPPTVVLSGINHGPNLGEDLIYSGTAAAAREAALLGIHAVALSQSYVIGGILRWDVAEAHAFDVLARLLGDVRYPGMFLNVNFPDVPVADVKGVRITRQGQRLPGSFRPRREVDGRFAPYYWIGITYDEGQPDATTDLAAVREGAVSITPLHFDATAHHVCEQISRLFANGIEPKQREAPKHHRGVRFSERIMRHRNIQTDR